MAERIPQERRATLMRLLGERLQAYGLMLLPEGLFRRFGPSPDHWSRHGMQIQFMLFRFSFASFVLGRPSIAFGVEPLLPCSRKTPCDRVAHRMRHAIDAATSAARLPTDCRQDG